MVGYIIESLPMRRIWKVLALVLCASVAIELSFGLNHTFFRISVAPAFLVLTARCSKPWAAWLCLFVGQTITLSVSPEMGFAFAVAGTAYAVIRLLREGNAWLLPVATPLVATLLFLMAAGGGYLRMLKLFSRGLFNLTLNRFPISLSSYARWRGLFPWCLRPSFATGIRTPRCWPLFTSSL